MDTTRHDMKRCNVNTNLTKPKTDTSHLDERTNDKQTVFQHARRGEFYDDDDDTRTECRRVTVRVRVSPDARSIDDKDEDECEDENEERINHNDCVAQSNE